jgi:hypothetical protein
MPVREPRFTVTPGDDLREFEGGFEEGEFVVLVENRGAFLVSQR